MSSTYFIDIVARTGPTIILFTRLEPCTLVTVMDVEIKKRRCAKYLVNVERTKTPHRLVTKQNFRVTSQDAFLMFGHRTNVKVASATPLQ